MPVKELAKLQQRLRRVERQNVRLALILADVLSGKLKIAKPVRVKVEPSFSRPTPAF